MYYIFLHILEGLEKGDMKIKKKSIRLDSPQPLSAREREVLMWLRCEKTSWAISVILKISERTVNFHVNNIMRKLGVSNRMQAVSEMSNHEISEVD